MHGNFPNKLTRKIHAEQCLVLYSRWRTQQTHAFFQLGFSAVQTSDAQEATGMFCCNTLLVFLLHNVSYRVSDRDNCIEICIVSWKGISADLPLGSCIVDQIHVPALVPVQGQGYMEFWLRHCSTNLKHHRRRGALKKSSIHLLHLDL